MWGLKILEFCPLVKFDLSRSIAEVAITLDPFRLSVLNLFLTLDFAAIALIWSLIFFKSSASRLT
jgi:hypothetical protein